MILYKFNQFLNRYYWYDMNEGDLNNPMYNETIHSNTMTPMLKERNVCGYCNARFGSRNQLFYHLNYHNIDTSRGSKRSPTYHGMHREDPDLGDEGFGLSSHVAKRIRRVNRHKKKQLVDLITADLDKISL